MYSGEIGFLNDFWSLIERMYISSDDSLVCLKQAFTSKNFKELKNISHKIKGEAANMMARNLREKSESVETNSNKGSCSETEYNTLVSSIEEFLRCTRGYQECNFHDFVDPIKT